MKKLLLTLAAVVGLGFAANAAGELTVDFSAEPSFAITTGQVVNKTFNTVDFALFGSYVAGGDNNNNYLMVAGKKQKNPIAYATATLPFDCGKVEITTSAGGSVNPKSKVNIKLGETTVQSELAVNEQNKTYTIALSGAKKGDAFTIESATTQYNQQFTKIVFYPTTTEPTVILADKNLKFATPLNGVQTLTTDVTLANVTETPVVTSDNEAFAVNLEDGVLNVEYKGNTEGTTNGTITVTADGVSATLAVEAITVANKGTKENPLTVSDVLAMNSLNAGPFYVSGVISAKTAATAKDGVLQEAETPVSSNIVLKENNKLIGVALAKNDIGTALNIVDNKENVGKVAIVLGTLENYYGAPGVKNLTEGSINENTGIDNIEAADNAPVEYFNLQGVRVANPENGLYIRRQGNKVTKVIVK